MLPTIFGNSRSVWIPYRYAIKFDFSPVNLPHVNLILRPARRTLKAEVIIPPTGLWVYRQNTQRLLYWMLAATNIHTWLRIRHFKSSIFLTQYFFQGEKKTVLHYKISETLNFPLMRGVTGPVTLHPFKKQHSQCGLHRGSPPDLFRTQLLVAHRVPEKALLKISKCKVQRRDNYLDKVFVYY